MDSKKTFDAVEMVRHIRDEHHEQLKGRTIEERLAFYPCQSRALRNELAKSRKYMQYPFLNKCLI